MTPGISSTPFRDDVQGGGSSAGCVATETLAVAQNDILNKITSSDEDWPLIVLELFDGKHDWHAWYPSTGYFRPSEVTARPHRPRARITDALSTGLQLQTGGDSFIFSTFGFERAQMLPGPSIQSCRLGYDEAPKAPGMYLNHSRELLPTYI